MKALTTTQPAQTQVQLLTANRETVDVTVQDIAAGNLVSSAAYVFWDASTTVPLASQDGTWSAPYASLQTAVTQATLTNSGGTVIALGYGDAAQTFTFDGRGINLMLAIVAFGGFNNNSPPLFSDVTLLNHGHVVMQGLNCVGVITMTNTRLWTQNCNIGSLQVSNNSAAIVSAFQGPTNADNSNPWALGNTQITDSAFYCFAMRLTNVVVNGLSTDVSLRQCQVESGGFQLNINATSTVQIDLWTMSSARQQSWNFIIAAGGTLSIVDAPTLHLPQPGFVIPAFVGIGQKIVAVPFTGAKPGDTFAIAWEPAGLTLPNGVMLGTPFVDTGGAGTVSVPVVCYDTGGFGGSTSFGVYITRFSVGL